jgi:hypothetical protein
MSLMIYLMLMSVDGHVKDEPNVSRSFDEWK